MTDTSSVSDGTPWYEGRVGTLTVAGYVVVTPALVLATAREVSLVELLDPAAGWLTPDLAAAGALLAVVGFTSLRPVPERVRETVGRGDRGVSALLSIAALGGLTVAVYGTPLFASRSGFAAVSLDTTVPFDVYLYAIVGAAARLSYDLVGDLPELAGQSPAGASDDAVEPAASPGSELLRLVVGLPAAVYLAAGVALLSDVGAGAFPWADSTTFVGFVGLAAGLFIKRAYGILGDVADRFLESGSDEAVGESDDVDTEGGDESGGEVGDAGEDSDDSDEGSILTGMLSRRTADGESGPMPWYAGWRGRLLLLGVFGVVLAVTLLTLEGDPAPLSCDDRCVRVPFDLYLYGFVGGLAYVFTTLFVDIERPRRSLLESKFRIVAGILLAVGAYVLLTPEPGTVAPFAFLVGLYPKVALERLDGAGRAFFDRVSETARGRR